jgi:transposase-like protein
MKRKLTFEEKEQIRALSGTMLQKNIASELNISKHLVRKAQKEFGLLPYSMEPLSAEMEEKVLALFRQGHGAPHIAKVLNLPQHRISRVREEYLFRHAPGIVGHRYYLSVEAKRALRRAIRTSERKIARDFGVSRAWLSKFRHAMWNPKKGAGKHSGAKTATPEDAVKLVTKVCAQFFNGKLPAMEAGQFVSMMMGAFELTTLKGAPEPVLDRFRNGLRQAVDSLRMAEAAQSSALVN